MPPAARRLLERPPSERFAPRAARADAGGTVARRRLRRAVIAGLGFLLAVGGTLLLVSVLALTTGLLFVAGASGLIIGSQLAMRPAVALTLAGVLGGDLAAWLVSRAEGGVLDPLAYAVDVFGPGLIGQVLIAALAAAYASSSIRSGR
jgi:hypothetical protein